MTNRLKGGAAMNRHCGTRLKVVAWSGAAALALLGLAGCSDGGDGDDGGSTVVLDDDELLSSLDDAEIGALCDWSNEQQGGYGQEIDCDNGITVSTQDDQATCKAEDEPMLMSCDQTVRQYKACTLRIAAEICDIGKALASADCVPLLPCLAGG
jgi:hypothetical protein